MFLCSWHRNIFLDVKMSKKMFFLCQDVKKNGFFYYLKKTSFSIFSPFLFLTSFFYILDILTSFFYVFDIFLNIFLYFLNIFLDIFFYVLEILTPLFSQHLCSRHLDIFFSMFLTSFSIFSTYFFMFLTSFFYVLNIFFYFLDIFLFYFLRWENRCQ